MILKKTHSFFFTLILFSFIFLSACCSSTVHKAVSVKLIHTNDHHSHLVGNVCDLRFNGVETRLEVGGFARLAGIVKQERDEQSIFVNSGELNGTLYFSLFRGKPDFELFNSLRPDGYTLGNHEFDEGDEGLAKLIEMAEFPILSSNMVPEAGSPLYRVKEQIKPYVIKEIRGEKIGIIGILKLEKTINSSIVSDDVAFMPEIESARKYVAELEGMGINKIILVSHVGYYNDIVLAKKVPGIDVIVGGDSHSLLGNPSELEEIGLFQIYDEQTGPFEGTRHQGVENEDLGSYPTTVMGQGGAPVHIVQAWCYAYGLGILNLEFNVKGIATKATGNIIMPVSGPFLQKNEAGERVEVSGDIQQSIYESIKKSALLTLADDDQSISTLLAPYREEIDAVMGTVIGTISETMPFDRIPGPFAAGEPPTGSYAAQVVCEAFRQANPRIDFAIQNAGGVRSSLLEGAFTLTDAIRVLPFSNTVVMLDMTGAQIRKVLNQAAFYALNDGSTGAFPYAAGLRYDVDLSGGENQVIFNIDMQDPETGKWMPLDEHQTYTVATNSFTALGKDNYLTFKELRKADSSLFEDTFIEYYLPLKVYMEKLPDQILPPLNPGTYCLKSVCLYKVSAH